jgi:hypothetical protein
LTKAFDEARADESGVKTVQLNVKAIDGIQKYLQILPKDIFNADKSSNHEGKRQIVIKTPVGTIIVSDNMFKDSDIKKAENVGIFVGAADISGLKSDIKAKIGNRPVVELYVSVDGKAIGWKNKDVYITISVDYTPTAEELKNPDSIVVWYMDGKGKVNSVPDGKYDAATGKVTFIATQLSK